MQITEQEINDFKINFENIEKEIKKEIVGQENIIRFVLISIVASGNVLLEGLPGLGKTTLVKSLSRALSLKNSRIQFTPDLMPADVTGTNIAVKKDDSTVFEFQKGPVFSNIVLADEINRATPKTQSSLLEAMQEGTVTISGETRELPKPFFVIATENPIELEGTYPLPEAQLDRFMFKLIMDYPNIDELTKIAGLRQYDKSHLIEPVADGEMLIKMGETAKGILIAEPVLAYAMKLILKTHPESEHSPDYIKKYVRFGSSPRGAQWLVYAAKIKALISNRFNVSYDDINECFPHVIRHRMFLSYEAFADNITADILIEKLLDEGK